MSVQEMKAQFQESLLQCSTLDALEQLKRDYLGKKGFIRISLSKMGSIPPQERKSHAIALNQLKAHIDDSLKRALTEEQDRLLKERLKTEWIDIALPGINTKRGARHPLNEVERRCLAVLRQLGFALVEGPEVDNAFHNFDALNIPEHHPARDMQDTFWLEGGMLLRSHTTTVQARVLGSNPTLPLRVASMGRVYRNEAVDATHLAMFHQLEGIWVEKGLTFAHLKGILSFVARSLYGESPIRFKPKFYPYTEPSVGVDLQCSLCEGVGCTSCHGAGWVTILGAGMIHPKVFETFGFDPEEVSGIAFGFGTTRMASQLVNAPTLRPMYDQDLSLLHAIHRGN
jgi:phenylalanyl-tRNA synthetase alpha chain